jgi:hypothetical protein
MKNLRELIAIEALISGFYKYSLWECFYTFHDKIFVN